MDGQYAIGTVLRQPYPPEGGRGCPDNLVQIALRRCLLGRPKLASFGHRHPGLRKSLRKEVIQPQVPLRLPCYDLVPVTSLAVGTDESRRLKALPASMT